MVNGVKDLELLVNALYSDHKLTGGTGASVGFGGPLRLEEGFELLGVPWRSDLSVVGGHMGDDGEVCSHSIRFYTGRANDGDSAPVAIEKWCSTSTDRDGREPGR